MCACVRDNFFFLSPTHDHGVDRVQYKTQGRYSARNGVHVNHYESLYQLCARMYGHKNCICLIICFSDVRRVTQFVVPSRVDRLRTVHVGFGRSGACASRLPANKTVSRVDSRTACVWSCDRDVEMSRFKRRPRFRSSGVSPLINKRFADSVQVSYSYCNTHSHSDKSVRNDTVNESVNGAPGHVADTFGQGGYGPSSPLWVVFSRTYWIGVRLFGVLELWH